MNRFVRFLLLAIGTLPAFAGTHYTANTKVNDPANKQKTNIMVEAWVDGEHAKILFQESENPMAKTGTYLLTSDGGKTVYLVDPDKKTFMEWDINQMLTLAGSVTQMVKLEFSDPEIEKLEESEGENLFGYKTRRHKVKTAYDMKMKILGMRQFQSIETVQETWVTNKLKDIAMGVWLRHEPPSSGNEELDRMIAAEASKIEGFPLRSKTKTITRRWNKKRTKVKKESVSFTEMSIQSINEQKINKELFRMPQDYEQVSMFNGNEQGSPFQNLFKKKEQ